MQISKSISFNQYIILFTTLLSIVVVLLGAFCRLADAGLGCPDWPGCYGHLLTVPQTIKEVSIAAVQYQDMPPLSPERMWPEMIHRYFAGSLGFIIFSLFLYDFIKLKQNIVLYFALFLLVVFQALLGMWTVTLKLHPVVVMGHLLGGFTITSILFWIFLKQWMPKFNIVNNKDKQKLYLNLSWGMVFVVFFQVFLGGWTSANYAALICPDFPFCNGALLPEMHFLKGFSIPLDLSKNYEFGLLDEYARVAIHMVHRFGAVVTSFIVVGFSVFIVKSNKSKNNYIFYWLIFVLLLQLLLGILNIKLLLPIEIAVLHNGLGLLLLMSCVGCCFLIKDSK